MGNRDVMSFIFSEDGMTRFNSLNFNCFGWVHSAQFMIRRIDSETEVSFKSSYLLDEIIETYLEMDQFTIVDYDFTQAG